MNASQPQPNFNAAISVEPLPPARAALTHAIECFDRARERLDEAQRALMTMENLRAPVSGREATSFAPKWAGFAKSPIGSMPAPRVFSHRSQPSWIGQSNG
jgi:hypothetical protein